MTNINRSNVAKKEYKTATKELTRLLSKKGGALLFIDELLTEAEAVMLVKRYAAVIMLERGYSPYRISDTIAVSLSTAQRLNEQYEEGNFDKMLAAIKPKEKSAFLSFLEDLILAQVSPRARARLLNRAS